MVSAMETGAKEEVVQLLVDKAIRAATLEIAWRKRRAEKKGAAWRTMVKRFGEFRGG